MFGPVFSGGRSCYTLIPKLYTVRKHRAYLEAIGKFTANAILNQELIGVDFADTFVKALYGQSMMLEDLKETLGAQEYSNYDDLQRMPSKDIDDLMYDFTVEEGGKRVPLLEDG